MCVHAPVHTHRVQKRAKSVLPYHFPPIPLSHSLSLNLALEFPQLGWKPVSPSDLLSPSP